MRFEAKTASDVLMRPVKMQHGDPLTQAAISIEDSAGDEGLYLVESGNYIGPGRNAATALGHTVLSSGCIAGGNGCFLASPTDSMNVQKGALDREGNLVWKIVYQASGTEIRYISFCGRTFFVTSRSVEADGKATLYVARSTNGQKWQSATFLSGADNCGSVAYEKKNKIFCSVGYGAGSNPNFSVLYSATSVDGIHWGTSTSSNPYDDFAVGGGNGGFVTGGFASGTTTISIPLVDGTTQILTIGTAQAQCNRSTNGSEWSASTLSVPGGSASQSSFGKAAIFANPVPNKGYFVLVVNGQGDNMPAIYVMTSKDGSSWSILRTYAEGGFVNLSLVGTKLGKIVRF